MEDSVLDKLVKALEKADGGSLIISDSLIDLYENSAKKKNPSFILDKSKLSSDKFKRDFCKFLLKAYSVAYEKFYKGYTCCNEVLARFWAGGIYGYQSSRTSLYWDEVNKFL